MASNETVYIKAEKNVEVQKRDVTLGDILTMESTNQSTISRLKTIKILKIPDEGQHRYVISILKIIECIHKEMPNLDIQSVGEADFIVTYEEPKQHHKLLHAAKTAGIVLLTFIGAAFSIMSFNNDVDITKMFSQIYELLTGESSNGFTILELTYSIGLIAGILIFFNHFGGRKFSVDPTPMEVEMRTYEKEIQDTLIENYAREKQEMDVGQSLKEKGRKK